MGTRKKARIGFNDPISLFSRAATWLFSRWVKLMYPFVSIGRNVSIHHTCDLLNTGLMQIGESVTIHKDVWLHAHENSQAQKPVLTVGDRCFVGRRCHIAAKNQIAIEDDVLFAASVLVQDHGHAFTDPTLPIRDQGVAEGGRIRIGRGSWIGQGAAIICDAGELSLGRNCVIAANSVVTRSAGAYSVLSGNPARVVKQYDPVKGTWVLGSVPTPITPPVGPGK
jgi:acetyltransferase-like isoleucine patch superfamily enzyme